MPERRRPPAQETMLGLITGYWVSQLVFIAANLGLADLLAKGPRKVEDLARKTGTNAPFLRRILRALASVGVFAETSDGRFKSTPLAATLKSDVPGSLRDFARMIVDDYNWDAWASLEDGVHTGKLAFDQVHGKPIFPYLRDHPEKDRIFSASMASLSGVENPEIARAYDFGRFATLVDVGGAHGHLLATILKRHRKLRGVLFDQPQIVAAAAKSGFISDRSVASRCEVEGGDFFAGVPEGAGGYVMKYIIHDWDDESAVKILRNCRKAMAPGGRVLVVEHVIPPGNGANWGKLLDINMMALTGGKERGRDEFRALFASAGLKLARVIPTSTPLSVLEGVA
jgi:hypothetical protein